MSTNKKVSVIITTYNRYTLLQCSFQSVLDQDYRPLEIVIVDDGSTDQTAELVDVFRSRAISKGIFFSWHEQENKGVSSARNVGLCKSNGEYILFHDSDDLLGVGRVSLQVKKLEETNSDLCAASIRRFGSSDDVKKYIPEAKCEAELTSLEIAKMHWGTQIFMYRRSVIINILWDEKLSCAEDIDFNFRVLQQTPRVCLEPEAITHIREVDDGLKLSFTPGGMDMYIGVRKRILEYYRKRCMFQYVSIAQAILLRTTALLWKNGARDKASSLFREIQPFAKGVISGGLGERVALQLKCCWLFCSIRIFNEWYGKLQKSK